VAKVVSLTRAITLTSPRGLFSFAVRLARRVSCPSDGRRKHEAGSSANRRNRRAKYDATIIVPLTQVYPLCRFIELFISRAKWMTLSAGSPIVRLFETGSKSAGQFFRMESDEDPRCGEMRLGI